MALKDFGMFQNVSDCFVPDKQPYYHLLYINRDFMVRTQNPFHIKHNMLNCPFYRQIK